jgi:aryl-alcohol dehydrogenase
MTTNALAAIARQPGGPLTIEGITLSNLQPGELLVRIVGVGLCHTDLAFAGSLQLMKPPAIFGHEGSGVVERLGEGVSVLAIGDHVVLTFISCGECRRCCEGKPSYCLSFAQMNYGGRRPDGTSTASIGETAASANFFGQSSFATYAVANQRNAIKIDKGLPLELMGPLGCGVQTGAGAIMRSLACERKSSVLILGGGAVGLSAVLGAVVQGCTTIIVVEPKAPRREMALQLGATHTLDPIGIDLAQNVRAILPEGTDYAFDTTGLPDIIRSAISCLAPNAKFGLVGISSPDGTLSVPLNVMIGSGFSFVGIIEGDSDPKEFIPEMTDLYRNGQFPFDKLITTYRFDQINQAIADQLAGKCIKPVMLTD